MRFLRRRDTRLELAPSEAPTCCLQDPHGFAPSIAGRILDVSRGGAAVLVGGEEAASLDPSRELMITAGLPGACARLKRAVCVQSQRAQSDGVVLGLRWVETDPADRYGQIQQARFEALLCQLLGRPSGAPAIASGAVGRLADRLRLDA
ncbi:MAG: PilZ domain-containing protein [Planctomycetes bacterium]|nr:PilZ domain-containing protein [Planctomycetota bacterium]